MKKPRRAEVNYCPQHPKGEATDTLALSTPQCVHTDQTAPKVVHFSSFLCFNRMSDKCIVVFQIDEFMRISTVPLISTFFAELDQYSSHMMQLFRGKGWSDWENFGYGWTDSGCNFQGLCSNV